MQKALGVQTDKLNCKSTAKNVWRHKVMKADLPHTVIDYKIVNYS